MNIGIDAISFDIPSIYLPIASLAKHRNIEPAKLEKGLGLHKMAFPDVHQDSVVFAANALKKLIEQHELTPMNIDRIYVGTESAVDGSKPIATYVHSLMEETLFTTGALSHCDVVDLMFACIGGVDALQNCLDYIKANPTKKAVVITTDIAKYDLASTGEYTQGAGAVALYITANPRIMAFNEDWAVSTQGVFDFFKPHHTVSKESIGIKNNDPWQDVLETEISIHKQQPVFDGQYSNQCYLDRVKDAYTRLKEMKNSEGSLHETWHSVVMHLPYCFQARRIFTQLYIADSSHAKAYKTAEDPKDFLKTFSKSEEYENFIQQKIYPTEIASGQIGNMYAGSIFMALLSALSHHEEQDDDITGKTFGFLAYGSGSKSKAFEGVIQPDWRDALAPTKLFETLGNCTPITVEQYKQLHKKELDQSILTLKNEFVLDFVEQENPVLRGARYYRWSN
ncbi:hydroxymethylglutaryl-CoA synthase [Gangjinia marincola]|uniref:Hydroxymethylglutaryl-CoA synthase n=1 Tax=Gangjinia marincola TaxID=578463 RepID=A0ABN1MEI0_9FLAO